MGRTIEIEGKTIDEAIFQGLEKLKLSFDEVEIFIIDEGAKGFLGIGNKPAKVRLEEREEEIIIPKDVPKAPAHNKDRAPEKKDYKSQSHKKAYDKHEIEDELSMQDDIFNENAQYVENEATEFLKELIAKIGLNGEVVAVSTDDGIRVNISGDNMGTLIGYRGETLDAIQYLSSLILNKGKEDYCRITIDTENYRKRREQTLVRLARRLAGKVRQTGNKVSLEPMNPFERRVIHYALQNDRYVTTHSEGDEPNRRVIICPKR